MSPDWADKPEAVPYSDLSNPQSLNLYGYVNNNPLSKTDPDGHVDWKQIRNTVEGLASQIGQKVTGTAEFSIRDPQDRADLGQKLLGMANTAASIIVPAIASDGLSLEGEAAGGAALLEEGEGAAAKTFQTYTKTNVETGEVYSGRTSGTGTPAENVAARDAGHAMTKEGYGPAQLDKSSSNAGAIRGREQQLIEANGGAKSTGGTSGNSINGVSPRNPNAQAYKDAANKLQ
jgi:hypothetical protein